MKGVELSIPTMDPCKSDAIGPSKTAKHRQVPNQIRHSCRSVQKYLGMDRYKGLKRGEINTDNINLEADEFEYNKITNILVANGNVIIKDLANDILIETENVTYKKNEEIIFTNTRSKATGKNTIINADSFEYKVRLLAA